MAIRRLGRFLHHFTEYINCLLTRLSDISGERCSLVSSRRWGPETLHWYWRDWKNLMIKESNTETIRTHSQWSSVSWQPFSTTSVKNVRHCGTVQRLRLTCRLKAVGEAKHPLDFQSLFGMPSERKVKRFHEIEREKTTSDCTTCVVSNGFYHFLPHVLRPKSGPLLFTAV